MTKQRRQIFMAQTVLRDSRTTRNDWNDLHVIAKGGKQMI